jgi:hypothetical protein
MFLWNNIVNETTAYNFIPHKIGFIAYLFEAPETIQSMLIYNAYIPFIIMFDYQ